MNLPSKTVALTLIKVSLVAITSPKAPNNPVSRKQYSNSDKCISVMLGLILDKCGRMLFPSAATKPSFNLQDAWGSDGSIALKATDNSSVHSGCDNPNRS